MINVYLPHIFVARVRFLFLYPSHCHSMCDNSTFLTLSFSRILQFSLECEVIIRYVWQYYSSMYRLHCEHRHRQHYFLHTLKFQNNLTLAWDQATRFSGQHVSTSIVGLDTSAIATSLSWKGIHQEHNSMANCYSSIVYKFHMQIRP